ncbi:helix-turn-helix domain-containing protein [Candidatus Uhrbacteria bacterium]|nr:helix-turn-helix domain-containing protein [Candidatus Uhrbacteria bacterium]
MHTCPDPWMSAGLDQRESAVYRALLASGPSPVAPIARRTNLHRPVVYRALAALESHGLVTNVTRGKRTHYVAEPPDRLRAMAASRAEELTSAIAALERVHARNRTRPSVRVLEGADGLRAVLADLTEKLPKGGTFYRYSSRAPALDAERFVPKDFRQRRDAKRLEQFVVTNAALRASPHRKRIECFSKVVPKVEDPFEYNVALLVYGDTIATVDYESETAIIIENPRIAKFHARVFRLLFDRL